MSFNIPTTINPILKHSINNKFVIDIIYAAAQWTDDNLEFVAGVNYSNPDLLFDIINDYIETKYKAKFKESFERIKNNYKQNNKLFTA